MTDELAMYQTDRDGWIAYVCAHMAAQFPAKTDADVARAWAVMDRPYQAAVWKHLAEPQRERVRKLRDTDSKRRGK